MLNQKLIIMKKKIYVLMTMLFVSYSVYSFVYRPDTWTTCLDESATFLDGAEASVTGSCVYVGQRMEEGFLVDVTQCRLPGEGMSTNCTGNGVLRADVGID